MPRTPAQQEPSHEPSSLVAAAVRLPTADRRYRPARAAAWQAEAWRHFDICGELRYAVSWFSNALSRATIHAAKQNGDKLERVDSGRAHEVLKEVFGGDQSTLLKAMGQHFFVAGEWYLVGRTDDGEDIWEVVSSQEMKYKGEAKGSRYNGWTIDYGDGVKIRLTTQDAVVRMWNPHPRRHADPHSPVQAVLSTLAEIEVMTHHIRAQAFSRLAGAGILFMPQGMSFPPPPSGVESPNEASGFMQMLGEVMNSAIEDPSDPSSKTPIVVTAPDDAIAAARHMKFWSELDDKAQTIRESGIKRLALGLDLPVEVLTGTGDVNHWGAWQIEESTIKAHIEPALELLCGALTRGLFRRDDEIEDDFVVAYDTTDLRLRPNRSKEAIELWDRGGLSLTAMLRETGFEDDDKPDDEETRRWVLLQMVKGSYSPEQAGAAAEMLGVILPKTVIPGEVSEGRPDRSLEEHPTRDLPSEQIERAALTKGAEVLVHRALERAGNRLRTLTRTKPPGIRASETYRFIAATPQVLDSLMADAFGGVVKECLGDVVKDTDRVEAALDSYCRSLLLSQQPHNRMEMLRFIDKALSA